MEGLTTGRIVHVVAEHVNGDLTYRKCQPATVVTVWPVSEGSRQYINAVVIRDGSNDSKYDRLGYSDKGYDNAVGSALSRWATSVFEGQKPYEFHDPRSCEVEQRG